MITRNVTETHLVGFLLELFDGSFIDSTAFVDQMASGSRFSRIYVTDDNDVDMSLFSCHCCTLISGDFANELRRQNCLRTLQIDKPYYVNTTLV